MRGIESRSKYIFQLLNWTKTVIKYISRFIFAVDTAHPKPDICEASGVLMIMTNNMSTSVCMNTLDLFLMNEWAGRDPVNKKVMAWTIITGQLNEEDI